MKCVQKSGLQTKGKYKVVNKLIEHAATCTTCTRYESLNKWSVLNVRTYKPAAEQILRQVVLIMLIPLAEMLVFAV